MARILVSSLVSVLLIIRIQSQEFSNYDPAAWKAAADFLLEGMDTTVDPCKNFHQYACGKWIRTYNGTYTAEMQRSEEFNQLVLVNAIKEIQINDRSTPKYHKSLKSLFDQCVKATEEEQNPILGIYAYTKNVIGPMPILDPNGVRRQDPYHLIGLIKRLLNVDILIESSITLVQEGCNLVPRVKLQPSYPRVQLEIQNLTSEIMSLGASNGVDLNETVETYRLSELPHQISNNVSWDSFFDGLLPQRVLIPWKARDPKLTVQFVEWFRIIDNVLDKKGYDQLVNFAYLKIFDQYLQIQRGAKRREEMMEIIMGKKNRTAELKCAGNIQKYASGAAARLLFENLGRKGDKKLIMNWKYDLDMLVASVLAASRYLIHTAEWLDSEDKAAVVDKVNSMRHNSAIPDWVLDDAAVLKHTPEHNPQISLFENQVRASLQKFEWKFESLINAEGFPIQPVSNVWTARIMTEFMLTEPDFNWDAFYVANSINPLLGLVLPPFYNYSYPLSVKFGGVGMVIGHELFHGFDYEGTTDGRADAVGRWLKRSSLDEFEKRSKCVMKQYSGYCDKKNNYCISGQRNIDENIADMDGIKVAYMAYKFLSQTMGHEPPLPGLERFTPDQLFFLSTARIWCGTGEKDFLKFKMGDTHSPPKARVELAMMNFPAFAHAFDCKMGTKFAPLHTCSLWGDFLEPKVHRKSRK